jgi:hypothetical protein
VEVAVEAQEAAIMVAQVAVLETPTQTLMVKMAVMEILTHQAIMQGQVAVAVAWLLLELTQLLAVAELVMVVAARLTGALGVSLLQVGSY